ncbi:MAG: hypothetical protein ACXVEF_18735 [Polyangiales bacterium]
MESPRNTPPVAVRVARPFATVDELLAVEANAFTRTGVVLIGAPSRPQGVVIRFEICLRDGTPVMRGEGRVVGHRPQSSADEGALMLRFTRLDVKSKEILDRAVALREERRSLMPPAPPKQPSAKPAPPAPVVAQPEPEPVAPPEPEHMDVDDADLTSADPSDLTEQAPPVAMVEPPVVEPPVEAAAPHPKEHLPIPGPSPAKVPVFHPEPAHEPPPHREQHEAPPHREQHEHLPVPTRSPNRPARAKGEEFRMSIEPEQRDSALEALRARAKRLGIGGDR